MKNPFKKYSYIFTSPRKGDIPTALFAVGFGFIVFSAFAIGFLTLGWLMVSFVTLTFLPISFILIRLVLCVAFFLGCWFAVSIYRGEI